jgi:cobalt transporter subunit CbtA
MLNRILFAALVAGVAGGLVTAVLQHFTTTPLILEAERYETGGAHETRFGAPVVFVHDHDGTPAAEAAAWAPGDGLERTLFTSLGTIGTTFGFALVLLSVMVLSGAEITARSALAWGLAGFAATGLAPALGLGPELPGSAAAGLVARQAWWIATAAATAAGLWLALRVASPLAILGGLALIVAPHVVGAPHPHDYASAVPSELSARFAAASLVVHAVAWSLTGAVAGYVWQHGLRRRARLAGQAR